MTWVLRVHQLWLLPSNNGMGAVGASALAPPLQHLTALQYLDLGFNDLGAEGAAAMALVLQQLTALQYLDLGLNDSGAEGESPLAPALQLLSKLQHLVHLFFCKLETTLLERLD
jgi:hypothetical protein